MGMNINDAPAFLPQEENRLLGCPQHLRNAISVLRR